MFKEGIFENEARNALGELERAIWREDDAESQRIAQVVSGLVGVFVSALNGFGIELQRMADNSERLAMATEALQQFAAVDINATIEQAIASREDNIAESAVEKFKKDGAARKFLGQQT